MENPKITTFIPYDRDAKLERSYNECMASLPDDDCWGCFIDHDAMFTTTDWFLQLQDIIKANPQFDCFTAVTNRAWNKEQLIADYDNHDIRYHRYIGRKRQHQFRKQVNDITLSTPISGVVILLKKSAWKHCNFRKWPERKLVGVDWMLHNDLKAKGYKLGLMKGIYVYHWYRAKELKKTDSTQKDIVVIATPLRADGVINVSTAQFCAEAMKSGHEWRNLPALEPNMSRNMLALKIMHDTELCNATHIMFLDADTAPPEEAIDLLLAHDKDVVCGVVPIVRIRPVWNVQLNDSFINELPAELFEIKRTGVACMLIKKEVFHILSYPFFCIDYSMPSIDMFVNEITQKTGGDFYFCDNLNKHGYKIWADPAVRCKHFQTNDIGNFMKE